MARMIEFYNGECDRFGKAFHDLPNSARKDKVDEFVNTDPTKISWTRALKGDLSRCRPISYNESSLVQSLYRPFSKQWMYFDRRLNEMVYQMPRIFPDAEANNLAICVSGMGYKNGVSAIITNAVPDFQTQFNGQCFPLYLYDEPTKQDETNGLYSASGKPEPARRDAITDEGLAHFQAAYPGEAIGKEDLFYYVYGLLHSPDYRERYANNLAKQLPRIPRVRTAADFRAFSKAGRALAGWHLNYETVECYPLGVDTGGRALTANDYRVEKMKYGRNGKEKDLTTLHYNDRITLTGIPVAAYEYVVNGKPALDWVVERQCVKTEKDSGIVNDANDWALETMHDPRYPLELFMRVVTVSLETMKIVNRLPPLDILES